MEKWMKIHHDRAREEENLFRGKVTNKMKAEALG